MIGANDLLCNDTFCGNFGEPADPEVCDRSHFKPANGPFRDSKVWVLDDKCPTCIFRPGNLMELNPGTREQMVESCIQRQAPISCHQTLDGPRSVCRGFYDVYRYHITPLHLAEVMGLIEFDSLPAHHTNVE
jgi:hypothetical protein